VILAEREQETADRQDKQDPKAITTSQAGSFNWEKGDGGYSDYHGQKWWEDPAHEGGSFWIWEGDREAGIPQADLTA